MGRTDAHEDSSSHAIFFSGGARRPTEVTKWGAITPPDEGHTSHARGRQRGATLAALKQTLTPQDEAYPQKSINGARKATTTTTTTRTITTTTKTTTTTSTTTTTTTTTTAATTTATATATAVATVAATAAATATATATSTATSSKKKNAF